MGVTLLEEYNLILDLCEVDLILAHLVDFVLELSNEQVFVVVLLVVRLSVGG